MGESSVVLFVKGRANRTQLVRLGELLRAMPVAGRRERAHRRTLRVGQQCFVNIIVIRAANKSHLVSPSSQRQKSAPDAEADDAAPSEAPAPSRFVRTVRAARRRFTAPLWAASRTRVSSISMKRDPRIALTPTAMSEIIDSKSRELPAISR
jgi:hypothetical protein